MAWKIDRDYLDLAATLGPDYKRVGLGTKTKPTGDVFRWRVLDDDGEVYYGGVIDAAGLDDDMAPGGLYGLLQWATADAGATDVQVRAADALAHGLTTRDYLATTGRNETTDWVSIYG